ncbi:OprO/OprP family phosphate-selective porin [Nitrospiraceae bacterium AH_259_D15_M11_P09]|nr:OprO/OprP family phosphate-selective porin [Nitrospiraceae bacterium AH_259_D15_M11_P09]
MKIVNRSAVSVLFFAIVLIAPDVYAGGKIDIDETKWISIGVGLRTSFQAVDDTAPNEVDWSKDFRLDNLRLYVNGQIHKNIKFEFNTDCSDCSGGGDMFILDAIGKFEFTDYFNVWAGRLLVPADRAELDGPFYHNTFEFNKTPFYPADFGSFTAGKFGRDDGVNIWGALTGDKRLTYVVGVFDGLNATATSANAADNLLSAGRVSYNFLNVEQNPGYYTSSTYYGAAGDVLTLAFAIQHQAGGAGTKSNPADFTGYSADALFEKVLPNNGVFTLEGEYKVFDSDLSAAALADTTCFCLFDGDAWTATGLYLFPQKVGIGQFQPYVRYTENKPDNSSVRDEIGIGINYVIDGHNARISLMYQYGDIATKGREYLPTTKGNEVSAIKLGLQLQL